MQLFTTFQQSKGSSRNSLATIFPVRPRTAVYRSVRVFPTTARFVEITWCFVTRNFLFFLVHRRPRPQQKEETRLFRRHEDAVQQVQVPVQVDRRRSARRRSVRSVAGAGAIDIGRRHQELLRTVHRWAALSIFFFFAYAVAVISAAHTARMSPVGNTAMGRPFLILFRSGDFSAAIQRFWFFANVRFENIDLLDCRSELSGRTKNAESRLRLSELYDVQYAPQ